MIFRLLVVLSLVCALSGCGRKGPLTLGVSGSIETSAVVSIDG